MNITLTITGTGAPDEKRIFREIMALLNSSTASTTFGLPSAAPVPVSDGGNDDDDGVAPAYVAPGETDASGMPWDERIHSGAKSKTDVGNWRKRKGVADTTFDAVVAELKARGYGVPVSTAPVATPTPTPVSVTPPTMAFAPPTAPAPMPVASPIPTPVAAPAPMPVASPIPTPVAAPIPTPTPTPVAAPVPAPNAVPDFPGIMQVISDGFASGKITAPYLQAVAERYQLGDNIASMSDNPAKMAEVWAQLKVDGFAV